MTAVRDELQNALATVETNTAGGLKRKQAPVR